MRFLSTLASAVVNLIVRLRGPVEPAPEDLMEWWAEESARQEARRGAIDDMITARIAFYDAEISRLRRNKKKSSHKVAERDALMREAGR